MIHESAVGTRLRFGRSFHTEAASGADITSSFVVRISLAGVSDTEVALVAFTGNLVQSALFAILPGITREAIGFPLRPPGGLVGSFGAGNRGRSPFWTVASVGAVSTVGLAHWGGDMGAADAPVALGAFQLRYLVRCSWTVVSRGARETFRFVG